MRNKFIYFLSLLSFSALICVFAVAQTNDKKEQSTSSNSVNEKRQDIQTTKSNYKPKDGYVPDEKTAIAIAIAVWNPIYGKEKIEGEKPFRANLKNGVWMVTGSLPKGMNGGVAEADISKDDGRILRIIHGK